MIERGSKMKKLLLTILLSFMFLNQIQAANWQEVIKNNDVTWSLDIDTLTKESDRYEKIDPSTVELWMKTERKSPDVSSALYLLEFDLQSKKYKINEAISYNPDGKISNHKRYPHSKFEPIIPDSNLDVIYGTISLYIKGK